MTKYHQHYNSARIKASMDATSLLGQPPWLLPRVLGGAAATSPVATFFAVSSVAPAGQRTESPSSPSSQGGCTRCVQLLRIERFLHRWKALGLLYAPGASSASETQQGGQNILQQQQRQMGGSFNAGSTNTRSSSMSINNPFPRRNC